MAESSKPIKRSAELAPLSREHHEGLLAAWKLRQGRANNIEPARMTPFVQWFWQTHLQQHFEKEERAFPTVLSPANLLLQQMFREHAEIKTLVHQIKQHGDLKKLEEFAQRLNDHIRFEERQLFPEVENAATPAQLQELPEQLKDEPNDALWQDEFWLTPKQSPSRNKL